MRVPATLLSVPILLAAGCASQPPAETASKAEGPRHCLRSTGTWLEVPEGECVVAPGRVITREDMERSGSMTTEEALRRLP